MWVLLKTYMRGNMPFSLGSEKLSTGIGESEVYTDIPCLNNIKHLIRAVSNLYSNKNKNKNKNKNTYDGRRMRWAKKW